MPTITQEPSGLIAIRALEELERERRAAEAAREAAATEARAREEAAAREAAEARARAEAEAAEQARRAEEARRHEERLRAIEIEASVRAAQAAHLARVQAELDASIAQAARSAGGRVGLWTAGSLAVVGLGLALLVHGTIAAPAPVAVAHDDLRLDEARLLIEASRQDNARIAAELAARKDALDAAQAALPQPAPDQPPPATISPRQPARPTGARPTARPATPGPRPGRIKICDTDDPLAEDC